MEMTDIRHFDRNEILNRAMKLFWGRGYEATSIRDLVETLRISRGMRQPRGNRGPGDVLERLRIRHSFVDHVQRIRGARLNACSVQSCSGDRPLPRDGSEESGGRIVRSCFIPN